MPDTFPAFTNSNRIPGEYQSGAYVVQPSVADKTVGFTIDPPDFLDSQPETTIIDMVVMVDGVLHSSCTWTGSGGIAPPAGKQNGHSFGKIPAAGSSVVGIMTFQCEANRLRFGIVGSTRV